MLKSLFNGLLAPSTVMDNQGNNPYDKSADNFLNQPSLLTGGVLTLLFAGSAALDSSASVSTPLISALAATGLTQFVRGFLGPNLGNPMKFYYNTSPRENAPPTPNALKAVCAARAEKNKRFMFLFGAPLLGVAILSEHVFNAVLISSVMTDQAVNYVRAQRVLNGTWRASKTPAHEHTL